MPSDLIDFLMFDGASTTFHAERRRSRFRRRFHLLGAYVGSLQRLGFDLASDDVYGGRRGEKKGERSNAFPRTLFYFVRALFLAEQLYLQHQFSFWFHVQLKKKRVINRAGGPPFGNAPSHSRRCACTRPDVARLPISA